MAYPPRPSEQPLLQRLARACMVGGMVLPCFSGICVALLIAALELGYGPDFGFPWLHGGIALGPLLWLLFPVGVALQTLQKHRPARDRWHP